MKPHVLLFGAGKSATVLIDYLIKNAKKEGWFVQVVDANLALAESKTKLKANTHAFGFDIENDSEARQSLIANAAIVISLLPPHLHILVAKDCIKYKRNLLTASYVDDAIKALSNDIEKNDLLFLYELGLDPGIDHLSAMQLIDKIKSDGGEITSFKSHCGGLVAPESDNNPWKYKVSWNPKNVVNAGKAGAIFKINGVESSVAYNQMFANNNSVNIKELGTLNYYPNRDSLSYIKPYHLETAHTYLRTTLRYDSFMQGWNIIVQLGLTNDTATYAATGKSLAQLFNEMVAATTLTKLLAKYDNANALMNMLNYLGWNDDVTRIFADTTTPAQLLQYCLEQKLMLLPNDNDMIVMLHEIEYEIAGQKKQVNSQLIVKGKNAQHTAMATTVGLPLGIAAKLILNGGIQQKGLQIPIKDAFYKPILLELAQHGIVFDEYHV